MHASTQTHVLSWKERTNKWGRIWDGLEMSHLVKKKTRGKREKKKRQTRKTRDT